MNSPKRSESTVLDYKHKISSFIAKSILVLLAPLSGGILLLVPSEIYPPPVPYIPNARPRVLIPGSTVELRFDDLVNSVDGLGRVEHARADLFLPPGQVTNSDANAMSILLVNTAPHDEWDTTIMTSGKPTRSMSWLKLTLRFPDDPLLRGTTARLLVDAHYVYPKQLLNEPAYFRNELGRLRRELRAHFLTLEEEASFRKWESMKRYCYVFGGLLATAGTLVAAVVILRMLDKF